MTIGAIESTVSEALKTRFEKFKSGQINVSKTDLEDLKAQMITEGRSTEQVDRLLFNFDKIDLNRDGLSFEELKTYKRPYWSDRRREKEITLDELRALRDRVEQRKGEEAAAKLDQVIQNFDAVDADDNGKLSPDELKRFADESGIKLPKQLRNRRREERDKRDDHDCCGSKEEKEEKTLPAAGAGNVTVVQASVTIIQIQASVLVQNYSAAAASPSAPAGTVSKVA